MLIGQSWRAQPNPFLPPASGAAERLSDVVGRHGAVAERLSRPDLPLPAREELDSATGRRRSGSAPGPSLRVGVNYLLIPPQQQNEVVTSPTTGQSILYGKREQLTLNLQTKLTRYWSLAASETINLTNSTNLVNGVPQPQSSSSSLYATLAAIYQDECMAFIGSVAQSGIRSGDVTPGSR